MCLSSSRPMKFGHLCTGTFRSCTGRRRRTYAQLGWIVYQHGSCLEACNDRREYRMSINTAAYIRDPSMLSVVLSFLLVNKSI
jgi:hypothetical protein